MTTTLALRIQHEGRPFNKAQTCGQIVRLALKGETGRNIGYDQTNIPDEALVPVLSQSRRTNYSVCLKNPSRRCKVYDLDPA